MKIDIFDIKLLIIVIIFMKGSPVLGLLTLMGTKYIFVILLDVQWEKN